MLFRSLSKVYSRGFVFSIIFTFHQQVKVEKYYTPEQQKAMEKKRKEEEERRARERGDNARERALNEMMGGVLEIKKEDELKKVY